MGDGMHLYSQGSLMPLNSIYCCINEHSFIRPQGWAITHWNNLLITLGITAGRGTGSEKSEKRLIMGSTTNIPVFALEIHTPYSKFVLKKTLDDFVQLQRILVQLKDT